MPATKPTVTFTDAVTFVYVLPFASVNDTVAVFVITVFSGVGDCARAADVAASVNIDAIANVPSERLADRSRVHIMVVLLMVWLSFTS
jgi:hypothetical protein